MTTTVRGIAAFHPDMYDPEDADDRARLVALARESMERNAAIGKRRITEEPRVVSVYPDMASAPEGVISEGMVLPGIGAFIMEAETEAAA